MLSKASQELLNKVSSNLPVKMCIVASLYTLYSGIRDKHVFVIVERSVAEKQNTSKF